MGEFWTGKTSKVYAESDAMKRLLWGDTKAFFEKGYTSEQSLEDYREFVSSVIAKCPTCGADVVYLSTKDFYGYDYDKSGVFVCECYPACKTYVGTHKGRYLPLGTLTNDTVRRKRSLLHSMCNRIESSGMFDTSEIYRNLAESLGIKLSRCHFGQFEEDMCNKAYKILDKMDVDNSKGEESIVEFSMDKPISIKDSCFSVNPLIK